MAANQIYNPKVLGLDEVWTTHKNQLFIQIEPSGKGRGGRVWKRVYIFPAFKSCYFCEVLYEYSVFATVLFPVERRLLHQVMWIIPWSSSTLDSSTILLGLWIAREQFLLKRNLPFLRVQRAFVSSSQDLYFLQNTFSFVNHNYPCCINLNAASNHPGI